MLRRIPPVILIVMLLAIYGFLLTFIEDPVNTLIILGLSVLLIIVVRNYLRTGSFFQRSSGPRKPKPTKPKSPGLRQATKKQAPTPRRDHPFRVIDGKKGKAKQKQDDQNSHNNISH
ncbi:hypothetical protein EDM59_08565 [Brevibacillus nitrificans]|uniref:Uncharacterized protein n=1 Tax=Brevibacillus nitrificans TaxID=651560 RepID=A0A3M8DM11_9BACL|nr:hypothetical protein [Brevibacillus nitrificans]MED1793993.1 hypothetical protein [Brevibacillus nitrificans]RNB89130.1 hypothetical protein EDM59_08565 [Brevibacillus nitrificans]